MGLVFQGMRVLNFCLERLKETEKDAEYGPFKKSEEVISCNLKSVAIFHHPMSQSVENKSKK